MVKHDTIFMRREELADLLKKREEEVEAQKIEIAKLKKQNNALRKQLTAQQASASSRYRLDADAVPYAEEEYDR